MGTRDDLEQHLLTPPPGHDHGLLEVGTKAVRQATWDDLLAWHRAGHKVPGLLPDVHAEALAIQERIRERSMEWPTA